MKEITSDLYNSEVKSLHKVEVSLHVNIEISEDKKVTLGNIATVIKGIGIESKIAEQIIQTIDEKEVERLCGSKYQRGNGENRYQRGGTCSRDPVTAIGKLNIKLHKVVDADTNKTYKPIYDIVDFEGKKVYQEDISMISVELATKMTYRDTVKEGKFITKDFPSPCTVNQRVIEYGEKIQELNTDKIENAGIETAFSDGTKTHSQEKGLEKNEINVVIGMKNGKKVILGAKANESWNKMAKEMRSAKAVTNETVFCGDAEKEMKNAMTKDDDLYQLDLVHAARIAGFKLWEDKIMSLEERKTIVSKLERVLYTLKNSVEKHFVDKNTDDLKSRINTTVDELKKMSKELWKLGCRKTATFIKEYSNNMVVFAKFAVNGRKVPWNSNIIERLMGEIAKRIKHKWMRWTTKGLETIINIILVRYCSEENYEEFKNVIMKSENLIFIKTEVKIDSIRGEF
jgi:uncharacterized protein YlzI (FlbEa/FlbD family)